jgi:radical SAM superfamily enzyme with C-terminal helix-hairpin-helix motif
MVKRVLSIVAILIAFAASGAYVQTQAQDTTPTATAEATAQATPTMQPFTLFNLNTVTAEELLTIPDFSNRMVREFMEYRPYISISQFRKEIGKYVDEAQVAAWEKYVYVPVQIDASDAETLKQIPGITDDIAAELIAVRPYNDYATFLTKLATVLTPEQVEYAKNYLDGYDMSAEATPAATLEATAVAQTFTLFDLNTATSEQLLTIPDFSNRMVREFMEYRPYISILQFRKEIGKYVDEAQVAAWEKYVYVPVQIDASDVETLKQIPGVTDEIAAELIAARPYSTSEAFLTKLATALTPEQVEYAKNYLEAK